MGRRHKPFFRLNAIDTRSPRDGKIIEKLGHYDPIEKNTEKQLVLNKERIEYWLGVGAVPSETVAELIAKIGIASTHYKQIKTRRKRARLAAKKLGLPFDNTQRSLIQKAAEKVEAEKAAEAEKAKAAEAEKAKAAEAEKAKAAEAEKAKAAEAEKAKAEKPEAEKPKAEKKAKAEKPAESPTEKPAEKPAEKAEPKEKKKAEKQTDKK